MSETITEIEFSSRKVFTNKEVKEFVGTRIIFTDGSWCDTENGKSLNNGQGYIAFDEAPTDIPAAPEPISLGPLSFSVAEVQLRELRLADIDVQPYAGDKVLVTLTGDAENVNCIGLSQNGDRLVIDGSDCRNRSVGGISITSVENVTITVKGSTQNNTVIAIKVPFKTTLSVIGDHGPLNIGNTEGDLTVDSRSNSALNAGTITNPSLRLSGMGKVTIQKVSGKALITHRGSGRLNISEGSLTSLEVDLKSMGGFTYGGETENAILGIEGQGNLELNSVRGRLGVDLSHMGSVTINQIASPDVTVVSSGQGKVRIRGGQAERLLVSLSGMGKFQFDGTAVNANLSVSGMGNIDINKVVNRPTQTRTGMGKIRIGNG